jgi:hypothetical protein
MSESFLKRHRWLPFVLPLLVYMLVATIEPTPDRPGGESIGLSIPYAWYPAVYAAKLALTLVAVALVFPAYRWLPWRVTPWSIVAGVVGVVLWVALTHAQNAWMPTTVAELLGIGERSAFNPFDHWADEPGRAWGFFVLRLVGLAVVVPPIEEFFLRGFCMRYIMHREWWTVPFGQVDGEAWAVSIIVPVLMHPAEILATAVWFAMITLLMIRTRSMGDCVVAHAVTNLLLGLWVLYSGQWFFL